MVIGFAPYEITGYHQVTRRIRRRYSLRRFYTNITGPGNKHVRADAKSGSAYHYMQRNP